MPNRNSIAGRASKVAAVTLSFWVLKIVITTVGDLSGDLLSITLGLGYVMALIVAFTAMLALLVVQIGAQRLHYLLYWALILLSSTVGAEFSDTIDRALHWGTPVGAGILGVCLVATLYIWRLRWGDIEFYPVIKREKEVYYWLAVIFANSLGSVLDDLVGDRLGLGVLGGIVVNIGVLVVLILLNYRTKTNKVLLFWAAFIFTRVSF